MAVFKEMDPADVWAAIEGHKDIISPAAEKLDGFYRGFSCPRCKGELQKEFAAKHVYAVPSSVAPRALLRCPTCGYLIDPHSNIVLEYGDASKIPIEQVPIINPDGSD
jgi:hypothetical protein